MKRTRLVLAGTAVAAATAIALLPSAAVGHTDHLFTWSYTPVGSDSGGFSTVSKTDASLALLGADTLPEFDDVSGMEVCNEVGYAVGWEEVTSESWAPVVATWDHTTGELLTGPTFLVLDSEVEEIVTDVYELDTLADCTVITVAEIDGEQTDYWAILQVDPATGDSVVLVELPEIDSEFSYYTGLATNSAGVTHIFLSIDGYPYFAAVDFGAGTIGEPIALQGLSDEFDSSGFTEGVDFDAADGLWVVTGVNAEEQYHLVSYAAGANLGTAAPTDIGIVNYYPDGELQVSPPVPLTAEGASAVAPAAPQLAATGSEAPLGAAATALALLVAGGVALALRRRTA